MNSIAQKFAEEMRRNRERRGWSQETLAEKIGTRKQVVSRYELGQREPKVSTASEIARELGLRLSDMIGER